MAKKNTPQKQSAPQGTDKKKKKNIGEKLALILAGAILVPTIALTACIILAQTTDMDFDWLAGKAAAIEEKKAAEEAAQTAEEEAAVAAKEQAAAEEEAAAAALAATSSSSEPESINVELIDNTALAPTPAVEEATTDDTSANLETENAATEEGTSEAAISGNLGDMVWFSSDNEYYHLDSACSGIINPTQATMQDAIYAGKTPCPKCCP